MIRRKKLRRKKKQTKSLKTSNTISNTIKAFIYGAFFIFIAAMFLSSPQLSWIIPLLYVLGTIVFLTRLYSDKEKTLKQYLKPSVIFVLITVIIDILMSGAFLLPSNFLPTILDAGFKILFSIVGAGLYFYLTGSINSGKKFFLEKRGILIRKFLAGLIDLANIMFIILFLDIANRILQISGTILPQMTIILIEVAVLIGYKLIYELLEKQTPGKKFLKIKIIGNPIQILIRNLNIIFFSTAFLPDIFANYIHIFYPLVLIDMVLFFFGKRFLDLISGCKVEKL